MSENNYERYTPGAFIPFITKVLGVIDLDPASCDRANEIIKAKKFYDLNDNGLEKDWFGNVYLNPPYGKVIDWVEKLFTELDKTRVKQIILLTNTSTSSVWFQELARNKYPISCCMVRGRINFLNGDTPTLTRMEANFHPNVFTYLGKYHKRFWRVFSAIGEIFIPLRHRNALNVDLRTSRRLGYAASLSK